MAHVKTLNYDSLTHAKISYDQTTFIQEHSTKVHWMELLYFRKSKCVVWLHLRIKTFSTHYNTQSEKTEKLNVSGKLIECNSYYIKRFSTVNFFDQSSTLSEFEFQWTHLILHFFILPNYAFYTFTLTFLDFFRVR